MDGIDPAPCFHHRSRDPVQNDESLLPIFDARAGNNEDRRCELRNVDLPRPAEVADLAVAAAGIDRKDRKRAPELRLGAMVNGKREQLEGILQQRYGYAKDRAKTEIDQWANDLK